jgi:methionine-S-sulfoxide reductase
MDTNTKTIIFGGGCFWCTEAVFKMMRGVSSVLPGYAGGTVENPTYEQVCGGQTGHAEVVKIEYDPTQTKLDDLLTVFFGSHDSTTLNRQGADVGTQYRSVVFYENDDQKIQIEKFIDDINNSNSAGAPVVTTVELLTKFYPAEDYHKDYFAKNPSNPYCTVIINPKLQKVQEKFTQLLK